MIKRKYGTLKFIGKGQGTKTTGSRHISSLTMRVLCPLLITVPQAGCESPRREDSPFIPLVLGTWVIWINWTG